MNIFTKKYTDKINDLERKDEHLREEFGRLFKWEKTIRTEQDLFMGTVSQVTRIPSWEEIFAHVGKILI